MAKLVKDGHSVETNHAPEIVALRSQGYADVPQFDEGGILPSGPSVITNETGTDEVVKPAPKPAK